MLIFFDSAIKTLAYRGLPKDCTREDIDKMAGENVKAVQFPVDSHVRQDR